jgi:hypothetical protein
MIRRSGALALLLAMLAAGLASTANAQPFDPPQVNVRVEGIHRTLFEGFVNATIHKVDGHDGTGPHRCNGKNGGAHKTPLPAFTAAFDNAARQYKLSWHAKWFQSFDDFVIDRVGPDSNTSSKFWDLELNWHFLTAGGCQQEVKEGDKLLIAYNSYGEALLKLNGPGQALAGKSFKVKVVNGRDGTPVKGAKVHGHKTNSNGRVKVKFAHAGTFRLKARKPGTIRSNSIFVTVKP